MKPRKTLSSAGLAILVSCNLAIPNAYAANTVTVPILLEGQGSDGNEANDIRMSWDHGSTPDPIQMRWATSQIPVRGAALKPLIEAFDYAMAYQSTTTHPTGILSLSITSTTSLGDEGSSVGAGLAVGFLALLRGDRLASGIAVTGTLESTGRIGPVRNIVQKVRIAAHQGYRVVLVPRGQVRGPRARLVGIGVESNVIIQEVGTIPEAYAIMTGKQLEWKSLNAPRGSTDPPTSSS